MALLQFVNFIIIALLFLCIKSQEQREASIQLTEDDINKLQTIIPENCLDEFEASLRTGEQGSMSDDCKYQVATALQKLGLLPESQTGGLQQPNRRRKKSPKSRQQEKEPSPQSEENWIDMIAPSKTIIYFSVALLVALVLSIASFVWENNKNEANVNNKDKDLFSDEPKKINKKKAEKLRQRNAQTPQ